VNGVFRRRFGDNRKEGTGTEEMCTNFTVCTFTRHSKHGQMNKDACDTYWKDEKQRRKTDTKILSANLNGRARLRDTSVDGRIILKCLE
jgi:hypothetical protein